ncbi:hypothetical protein AK830_g8295 [Neonectria ditissima]|uniref:DUF4238 domain-containing protein n=1 Tax=Neonectria ditissima TaxID=78410 RepID=A0A0P7BEI7_9HYPO|nr:hypothetical protein AK830_g8295 [Neonectria ditissima]
MPAAPTAQYQHFIPQFLVKNFSHPYDPPKNPGQKSKRSRQKYNKGMYPGDPVIRHVDLTTDPPVICEKPTKRILGNVNMYQDTSQPTPEKQQHVEQMFSKLESEASVIFRKITKSFQQQDTGLWLTRVERNIIRKFLFLLKYRGSDFHRRFYHDSQETYNSNDQELLREYMQEKGYSRPVDTWFDNIKTIMNLDMDPAKDWITELPRKMFPLDARWFIAHVQMSYMAIWTPSEADAEFIVTDNSYNIFEGPNTFVTDGATGKVEGAAHTPLHEFSPISPKLMIVLRSLLLPNPKEDANPEVAKLRAQLRFEALDKVYSDSVESVLADLPIAKAENSYSKLVMDFSQTLDDKTMKFTKDDKFHFKFFAIKTGQVHLINALLLDNAQLCTSVVFESEAAFSQTLEWYLTTSCTVGKIVSEDSNDPRLVCLKKLAAVLRGLGSNKEPVWRVVSFPTVPDFDKYQRQWTTDCKISEMARRLDAEEYLDNPSMQVYRLLGGSAQSMVLCDLEQAHLMLKLRIKIDSWSQGVNEIVRQRNRLLLIDAYLRLPPCRVWVFLKMMRHMVLGPKTKLKERSDQPHENQAASDPEDVIARASHIIRPENLAQLMYKATMNDLDRKKLPASSFRGIMVAFAHRRAFMKFIFERPGPIRFCGIPEIEQLALRTATDIIESRSWTAEWSQNPLLDEVQVIELTVRKMVKSRFVEELSGRAERSLLEELQGVFFDVAYPIPDFKMD